MFILQLGIFLICVATIATIVNLITTMIESIPIKETKERPFYIIKNIYEGD